MTYKYKLIARAQIQTTRLSSVVVPAGVVLSVVTVQSPEWGAADVRDNLVKKLNIDGVDHDD